MDYILYNTYQQLINFAKTQKSIRSIDSQNYYEVHHIVPKSAGGTNDESNLVTLTLFEHFQAHYLLAKQYENLDNQKFFANISACSLLLTGKRANYHKLSEIEDMLKNPNTIQLIEEIKRIQCKRVPPIVGKLAMWKKDKNGIEQLKWIEPKDKCRYMQNGWKNQVSQKKWLQFRFQKPRLINEKSWEKLKSEGYHEINECPICHKANDNSSFACCEEHEKLYLATCWNEYKQLKVAQSTESWKKESDRLARIKGLSEHFSKHPYIKGLRHWMWIKGKPETATQVKEDVAESYLKMGYIYGRPA